MFHCYFTNSMLSLHWLVFSFFITFKRGPSDMGIYISMYHVCLELWLCFMSVNDFIWLKTSLLPRVLNLHSADHQAVFKAQNNRLRLKGLFFVPVSLIEFEEYLPVPAHIMGPLIILGVRKSIVENIIPSRPWAVSVQLIITFFCWEKSLSKAKTSTIVRFCPPTSLHAVHYTSFCIPTL